MRGDKEPRQWCCWGILGEGATREAGVMEAEGSDQCFLIPKWCAKEEFCMEQG